MNDLELTPRLARRIIDHVKAGTTQLEGVEYLNAGREEWFRAAERQLDELSEDRDAVVRFIKGYYGDGKTHFMGMVRSIALRKNWVVTYISAENTPLNKFDTVYAAVVRSCVTHEMVQDIGEVGFGEDFDGIRRILDAWYGKMQQNAIEQCKGDDSDTSIPRIIREQIDTIVREGLFSPDFRQAVVHYAYNCLQKTPELNSDILRWLRGENVRLKDFEILAKIDRTNSVEIMRSLVDFFRYIGFNGLLILVDEVERILTKSKKVRNDSYQTIRSMMDNTDGREGMKGACFYCAATPDMFDSPRGFSEYDALLSRLNQVVPFSDDKYVDWRAVVIELESTPLPKDVLLQIGEKIRDIHGKARKWNPEDKVSNNVIRKYAEYISNHQFNTARPRIFCSTIANVLERAEQHPNFDPLENISEYVDSVSELIESRNIEKNWDE